MKTNRIRAEELLAQATEDIRSIEADRSVVEAATRRVAARLASDVAVTPAELKPAEHLRGCDDFQTLIPSYLARGLSESRTMLFEDHVRECVPCRKALKTARTGAPAAPAAKPAKPAPRSVWTMRPAMAASILAPIFLALALAMFLLSRLFGTSVEASTVTIDSTTGGVYRVVGDRVVLLRSGEKVARGERIRTGKDAHAIARLADGSRLELKERTEFHVTANGDGTTVNLDRGNVIVEAAKQRDKHLFVATSDNALVSVTGTIFAVNTGVKGSRVSVVEGEVHVTAPSKESVLHPGEQVTTSDTLDRLPVKDEVAWSQDADKYTKLLADVAALREEINTAVPRPGVRTTTRLLDRVPADTVFYAAFPNLSETLRTSNRIIQERVAENPTLREWWQRQHGADGAEFNRTIEELSAFLDMLGPEIVLSVGDAPGKADPVVILAEAKDPAGFRTAFEQRVAKLVAGKPNGAPEVIFVNDPATLVETKTRDGLYLWVHDGIVAATVKPEMLASYAAGRGTFAGTPFYATLAQQYREGVNVLIAADVEKLVSTQARRTPDPTIERLGITNLKHFVANVKDFNGAAQNHAEITFDRADRGITTWLAAPGAMGALEYVSQDASLVTAFVIKDPKAVADDLLDAIGSESADVRAKLTELETKHGINLRDDFAAPLGGEFAVALDGPVLPSPSWKLVIEVYDPARMQQSIEKAVTEVNRLLAAEGKPGIQLTRSDDGGRTFHRIAMAGVPAEINYAFVNGYLIAAPSRTLIDRAILFHDAGTTLTRSARFKAALPANGQTNFSAVFYQNVTPMIEQLGTTVGGDVSKGNGPDFTRVAQALPTLACAYAYPNRIVFATSGGNGLLSPADLFGVSPFNVGGMTKKAKLQ